MYANFIKELKWYPSTFINLNYAQNTISSISFSFIEKKKKQNDIQDCKKKVNKLFGC